MPATMQLTMVAAAQWHREFIADLAPKGRMLGESQVVGVARCSAADQAGLLGHELDVFAVTQTPRLGKRQKAFIDGPPPLGPPIGGSGRQRLRSLMPGQRLAGSRREGRQSCGKCRAETLGIGRRQPVLFNQPALCPICRLVAAAKIVDLGKKAIAQLR